MTYNLFVNRCSLGLVILTMLGSSSFAMDKEDQSSPTKACTSHGKNRRSAQSPNKPTCYESTGSPQPAPQPPPLFPLSKHLRFAIGLEGPSEEELEKSCLKASAAAPASAKRDSGRKRKSHNGRDDDETKHTKDTILSKNPREQFLSSSEQNRSPLKRKTPQKQEVSDSTPVSLKEKTLIEQYDAKIAAILFEKYRREFEKLGKFEDIPTITAGFAKYLSDRRQRKMGLTKQQLLDLLFPNELEAATDKGKAVKVELEALLIEESWLQSFGPTFSQQDQNDIPEDLENLEKKKGSIRATGGDQSAVKEITKPDGQVVYFKTHPKGKADYDDSKAYRRARREVIAYRLSQTLGLDLVEETKVMRYQGKIGSVRNNVPKGFKPLLRFEIIEKTKEWQQALSELWVFDFIGGFHDRHLLNLFFNKNTYKIKGIDYDDFPAPIPIWVRGFVSGGKLPETYPPNLAKLILELKFAEFSEKMSAAANPPEIESLWMRIQIVKADIQRKQQPQ